MNSSDIRKKWPIVGNDKVIEYLVNSISAKQLTGTFIFSGSAYLGKKEIALYFAKVMLCQNNNDFACDDCDMCKLFDNSLIGEANVETSNVHGDFYYVEREKGKKHISIEQVRDLIRSLGMSSFLNSYKVGILIGAEHLNESAANALLKTLEEPKDNVVIILVTDDIDSLPKTIISRSKVLRFCESKTREVERFLIDCYNVDTEEASYLAGFSLGRPGLALRFFGDAKYRDEYFSNIEMLLNFAQQSVAERFVSIDKLVGAMAVSSESVKKVNDVLGVWQGVLRDSVLLNSEIDDIIQNKKFAGEISNFKNYLGLECLMELSDKIINSRKLLKANVNPKLVLENIAISL